MNKLIPRYQTGGLLDTDAMRSDARENNKFFKKGEWTNKGRKRLSAISQIESNQDQGLTYDIDNESETFVITDNRGNIVSEGYGHGMLENEGVNNPIYGMIGRKKIAKKEISKTISGASKYTKLKPRVEPEVELEGDNDVPTQSDVKGTYNPSTVYSEGVTDAELLKEFAPNFGVDHKGIAPKGGVPIGIARGNGSGGGAVPGEGGGTGDGIEVLFNTDLPEDWTDWAAAVDVNMAKLYTGSTEGFTTLDGEYVPTNYYLAEVEKRKRGGSDDINDPNSIGGNDGEIVAGLKNLEQASEAYLSSQAEYTSRALLDYLNSEIIRIKNFEETFSSASEYQSVLKKLEDNKNDVISKYTKFRNSKTPEAFEEFYNGNVPVMNDPNSNPDDFVPQYYWDNENKLISTNRVITDKINKSYKEDKVNEEDWSTLTNTDIKRAGAYILYNEGINADEFDRWLTAAGITDRRKSKEEFKDLVYRFRTRTPENPYSYKNGGKMKIVKLQSGDKLYDYEYEKSNNFIKQLTKLSNKDKKTKLFRERTDNETDVDNEGNSLLSKTGVNTPFGQVQYSDIAQFMLALRAKNKQLDSVELNPQEFVPSGSRNVLAARDMDSAMLNQANDQISKMSSRYKGSDPVMSMISEQVANEAKNQAKINLISARAGYRRQEEDRVAGEMEMKRGQEAQDALRAAEVDNINRQTKFQAEMNVAQDKARRDSEFANTLGTMAASFQSRANMKAQGDKQLKTELAARDYQTKMGMLNKQLDAALAYKGDLDYYGGTETQKAAAEEALNESIKNMNEFEALDRASIEEQAKRIDQGPRLFPR